MYSLFVKGGPIMWLLLATSVTSLSFIIERLFFVWNQKIKSQPQAVRNFLLSVNSGRLKEALSLGAKSEDPILKVLTYGLRQKDNGLSVALSQAAADELKACEKGISILDTVVTLAPLLGLLGTVTGMIRSFGLLGTQGLDTPVAITGGVAEALICTAFGLIIAIMALIPLNYLSNHWNGLKHRIEQAATDLELILAAQGHFTNFRTPVLYENTANVS